MFHSAGCRIAHMKGSIIGFNTKSTRLTRQPGGMGAFQSDVASEILACWTAQTSRSFYQYSYN